MERTVLFSKATLPKDLVAGSVVFLVALPLCLGVALASNAPLFSGVLAGIVGGLLVGMLSGSHSSVSGPAAGLTAIVSVQIASLGKFETFLLAVVVAGVIQIILGVVRAGFLSAFFPSSVIQGLLSAIGVILILKQIPHVLGHDADPEGDMAFFQPDEENSISELLTLFYGEIHIGAIFVGLGSILLLLLWDRVKALKKSIVPAPLLVVVFGVLLAQIFDQLGGVWQIGASHLVQVPVTESITAFMGLLQLPDFTQWNNPAVYMAGLTIAAVASLESLLNLEAVDKLDPKQRNSPSSRELFAQGVGNVASGMIGGIPVTSVIVRSSVNLNVGAQTKISAIFHGFLLLICAMFLPRYLNMIPLSCLAAILLMTGIKLISPKVIQQMWSEGRYQFIPFIVTLVAIVLTDLIIGIGIGLAISLAFILNSNLRRPLYRFTEKHLGGEVIRIALANQVSFLNRAALDKAFSEAPRGSQMLLDATSTDYIDPDILNLVREFKYKSGPIRGVQVSLRGFRSKFKLENDIRYVDYSTRELQSQLSPVEVLEVLREGNERFRSGQRLTRDLHRQLEATAKGQHPLAVVLSCIDSRTPAELIFDLGLGDIFSIRMAGNVSSPKVLGSIEYGCAVAGAKLILVVGHTQCGAVAAAVNLACSGQSTTQATGCENLNPIIQDIQKSVDFVACRSITQASDIERQAYVDAVARRNVQATVDQIVISSRTVHQLIDERKIAIVGAMYEVSSGRLEFLTETSRGIRPSVPAEV